MRHDIRDRISFELARAISAGLAAHPEWIDLARANLDRWERRNSASPALLRCYSEWRALLERSVEEVAAVLVDPSDTGQRLRQNSPFAGALTPAQVWEIKRCHAAKSA